jgi:hypothetical protein
LQNGTRPLHEESPQVRVPAFANPEQLLLASGGLFAPDDSEPGCELSPLLESCSMADPNTFMLLGTVNSTYSTSDLTQTYRRVVLFSDFRNQGAVTIPFAVTEIISGQKHGLRSSLLWPSTSASDADFTL